MGKQGPARGGIKFQHGRTMKTSKTMHVGQDGSSKAHSLLPQLNASSKKCDQRVTRSNVEAQLAIQSVPKVKMTSFKALTK